MSTDSVDLFLRMLLIGLAVAAPVGAMGVLSIQRTLADGWRAGMATGAGIATADALFAALAAFGVTAISELLVSFQTPLRIAGGFGLIWLGWRALRARPQSETLTVTSAQPGHFRCFSSAVGLTLTNPMTIIAFGAIFAGAGLVAQPGVVNSFVVTLGVAAGSLLWWLILVSGVKAVRHALSDSVMQFINRASGFTLMVFGALALVAGILAFD